MKITRLRLSGFKSFVEPSEFQIEPGLTGIVGPNGCGKSNLVDALRWVMGENSARKVRGTAMEDVIFSGTTARPGRSHAEVALHIDNSERRVPAPYNDAAEIEVTRRIERDSGSTYRINGREVRARDVQLVFADLHAGAHSVSFVSQGRVDVLVQAKPADRRILLEEAAGITGLYSRRHEAELRLGAATTNLERLGDVIAQIETQLQGLKRLARQASRYRSISTRIREAEAALFRLRHRAAAAQLSEAEARKHESLRAVAAKSEVAAAALVKKEAVSERLPALRSGAVEVQAALHRLTVAREGLDEEAARIADEIKRLEQQSRHVAADIEREEKQIGLARAAEARLDEETAGLAARASEAEEAQASAATHHAAASAAAVEKTQAFEALTARAARQAAQRESLIEEMRRTADHLARLARKAEDIVAEQARLATEAASAAGMSGEGDLAERRKVSALCRNELDAAESRRRGAEGEEESARDRHQEADLVQRRLVAEEKGLLRFLAASEKAPWPPVIDRITVTPGYEAALAAALGDELQAAEDADAPVYWKALPPLADLSPLPPGAESLARFVEAPAALSRRLAAIGIVTEEVAPALATELRPGQRLVSRNGGLWRWDGFTIRPGAPSTAALRLEHQNRLKVLRQEMVQAEQAFREADEAYAAAREKRAAARAAETQAEAQLRAAEAALKRAEAEAAKATEEANARAIRIESLETAAAETAREIADANERQAIAEEALRALSEETRLREEVAAAREHLQAAREAEAQAQSRVNDLTREAAARDERLAAIRRERVAWVAQGGNAARQIEELHRRAQETAAELAKRREAPEAIAAKRAALLDQISATEAKGRETADILAAAENELRETERAAKLAQEELGATREDHARAETEAAHAERALAELIARIRETFAEAAGEVLDGAVDEAPNLAQAEARFDRLQREREAMGPVNLRAEIEAAEVEEQLANLGHERADLEAAIGRLRQGIASLNREGRERLVEAFDKVNGHFRELFMKAFGGGEAHLKFVDSDDPLTAGLELYAQPPGKKLQSLSLLSGGEQALTALSLIFAVFLTNPAPLCVLDEVDAPLDDANTDRLCDLLEELARTTSTRFLIVTHQPLTMARMDRLYGVTMQERGVSQLVSVDLAAAEAMRQSA